MADEKQPVEKVAGTWNGMPVRVKKVWSTHEFTADEMTKLFNGETIEFETLHKTKGTMYTVKGRLEKQSFVTDQGETVEYVGFAPIFDKFDKTDDVERFEGTWNGKTIRPKRVFGSHRFTDEEVSVLLEGGMIKFEAISNNTGSPYPCKGKLEEQTYQGRTFVGFKPDFS